MSAATVSNKSSVWHAWWSSAVADQKNGTTRHQQFVPSTRDFSSYHVDLNFESVTVCIHFCYHSCPSMSAIGLCILWRRTDCVCNVCHCGIMLARLNGLLLTQVLACNVFFVVLAATGNIDVQHCAATVAQCVKLLGLCLPEADHLSQRQGQGWAMSAQGRAGKAGRGLCNTGTAV